MNFNQTTFIMLMKWKYAAVHKQCKSEQKEEISQWWIPMCMEIFALTQLISDKLRRTRISRNK